MFLDFEAQTNAAKKAHCLTASGQPIKKFYYLWFIATEVAARGKGLAGRIVKQWQERAARENQVIWLEATTPRSREVYLRCGFKVMSEIKLGKGTHSVTGTKEQGGPGVPIFAMLWRPDFADEKAAEDGKTVENAPS